MQYGNILQGGLNSTYNNSNTEQLGVCVVKLRYKDKIVRYRFFAVPGEGQALLGIPDIEFLGKLKMMCDVIESQEADRKCNSQTMEPSSTPCCKANTETKFRSDNVDAINSNSKVPDSFRCITNREAD